MTFDMTKPKTEMLFTLPITALLVSSAATPAAAERSEGTPICDYYAQQLYDANNVTTQLKLMSSIVAYAYAGGDALFNPLENSTGIFNPGTYEDTTVYLRPFFDGSRKTTNLNDAPVAMDWLDGGGTEPLLSFLNGKTNTVEIEKDTNQYTLFTHWHVAFGRIYNCTQVEDFVDKKYKTLTPAYVHKYMDLDRWQVAYFIRQIILASKYYGFSDADAQSLETLMNDRYNTRCAPAIDGTLYSICLSDTHCPVAAPKSDCEAYKNVQPYGLQDTSTASTSGGATGTATASTTIAATATETNEDLHPPTDAGPTNERGLGYDVTVGIVVGAVAGVALLGLSVWCLLKRSRRRQRPDKTAVSHEPAGTNDQHGLMYHTSHVSPSPGEIKHQSQYTVTSLLQSGQISPPSPPPPPPPPTQQQQQLNYASGNGNEQRISLLSDFSRREEVELHELDGRQVTETAETVGTRSELSADPPWQRRFDSQV